MPWLEVLLLIVVVLTGFSAIAAAPRRTATNVLTAVAVLVLVLHLVFEGAHWQMAPAYLGLLLCLVLGFAGSLLRRLTGASVIALALVACGLSIYLPIFKLPAPTGSYAIGTQILPLVDPSPAPGGATTEFGRRAFMVQVWYPAAASNNPIAPYRIRKETTLLSSYQSVVRTHARWDAPIAPNGGPFPILLLNPAWNSRRSAYMYLVEDLVSHGYVVIGIDHTGNSGPVAFPDGHVGIPPNDTGLDSETHSYEEMNAYGTKAQAIQVEDDKFVLDQLDAWNRKPGGFYRGKLDTERIGAFGHSFGGSVSAEIAAEDPRVKAALDMDGSFWPPIQNKGLSKPLMMIEEDYDQFSPEDLKESHVDAVEYAFDQSDDRTMANSNGYRAVLHGSTHVSYTDRSLYSPFKRQSGVGSIPGLREYAIIRSYTLAFFDKTLKGINSRLLTPEDKSFPEATLTILKRPPDPGEVRTQAPVQPKPVL